MHITFNALPESEKKDLPTGNILLQGFKVKRCSKRLKCTKHLTDLFAFFIMSMAIQTIMLMASSFGKKVIKLETTELIIIIFVVNLLAIPGAFGVSAR